MARIVIELGGDAHHKNMEGLTVSFLRSGVRLACSLALMYFL